MAENHVALTAEQSREGRSSTASLVCLAQHPTNLDPTAHLVSGPREEISIFRTSAGFVACRDGMAIRETFQTEQAARDALARA